MNIENSKTEQENKELFHRLFANRESALKHLAPDGWTNSPLYLVHHPTPEQRYKEALRIHNNLKGLLGSRHKDAERKPPKPEDFFDKDDQIAEVDPLIEFVDLLGLCVWDIFSDNHEVVASDGRVHDIGSFRGAAGFIAEYINQHVPEVETNYDYIDFYMGTIHVRERANLIPVYELIFRNLRELDCDWIYYFPRLGIVDMGDLREELKQKNEDSFLEYEPGESLAEELERADRKKKLEAFREKLDRAYRDEVEEAKFKPLPRTIQAYRNVYRQLPTGWPHK